jgi:hypothetical protein
LKRLVYEAREDPTKVQAYVDGLKAEINKVGNTPRTDTSVDARECGFFPESRLSNLETMAPRSCEPFGASR